MSDPHGNPRLGRSLWAMVAFLVGFAVLITFVSYYFLFPAMEAAANASPNQKRQLMAYSRLLLAIVLFILVSGLFLFFRIGRFFFPRATIVREKTQYIDAWSEAGRRAKPDAESSESAE
jgi:hypothetical protein